MGQRNSFFSKEQGSVLPTKQIFGFLPYPGYANMQSLFTISSTPSHVDISFFEQG